MKEQNLTKEIKQLEIRLVLLKRQLEEIQKNCEHQFIGSPYSETCMKCNKVNVLYY
ncbi:serine protease [Bacillus sp. FJAT-49705]|uniref:Serine protease n=1 Tax=Cytobacillus citreus TaxID=2833586 RepID=A0ABS5NY71_9BACI|nr:serine protease [Cytobacillus citreus]MBS4192033.1 serine protease [Cytobacillus citreus]